MDASVYSTDYQQVSQQLSLQSQRQIKVKVQNFLCAQIPRSLSSVSGKEMIEKKSCFHKAGPAASVYSWETTGFGQSLASILPYASLVKNIRTLQEPISSISYKSGKLSCRASHHEKRRSVYYLHIQIRRW